MEPPLHRAYPRRLTIDLSDAQHRQLKVLAAENGVAMTELLRAAVEEMLTNQRLAQRLVRRAEELS
jgi:hypothetical protein